MIAAKIVKLKRALYGVKQAGRQWSAPLCNAPVDKFGMDQCGADPHMFPKVEKNGGDLDSGCIC